MMTGEDTMQDETIRALTQGSTNFRGQNRGRGLRRGRGSQRGTGRGGRSNQGNTPVQCWSCSGYGHYASDCKKQGTNANSVKTIICYNCNKPGHVRKECWSGQQKGRGLKRTYRGSRGGPNPKRGRGFIRALSRSDETNDTSAPPLSLTYQQEATDLPKN